MLKRVPPFFKNFYFLSACGFLLWMAFLDNNNLIARFQLRAKLRGLEREQEYYMEKIKEVEQDRQELFGDKHSVEKFAREKYFMKKDAEDVFVIEEKD